MDTGEFSQRQMKRPIDDCITIGCHPAELLLGELPGVVEDEYAAMADEIDGLQQTIEHLTETLERAEVERDELLDQVENLEEERQKLDDKLESIYKAMDVKKHEHETLQTRLVANQQSHVIHVREVHKDHHEEKKVNSLGHVSRGVARSIFFRHRQQRAVLRHLQLFVVVEREREEKFHLRDKLEAVERQHRTETDARVGRHKERVRVCFLLPAMYAATSDTVDPRLILIDANAQG